MASFAKGFITLFVLFILIYPVFGSNSLSDLEEEKQIQFFKILKSAKPAPNPPGPLYDEGESASREHTRTVGYNLQTGETTLFGKSDAKNLPLKDRGRLSVQPFYIGFIDDIQQLTHEELMKLEGVDCLDCPDSRIVPTPPTPVIYSLDYPWCTVSKLLLRFESGGQDYYYVCSAVSAGDFHLLTAGHCIFNWDPNKDGDTRDGAWASEIWAWPGQTDRVDPEDRPDAPYGVAKSVYLRSYIGWTQDHNYDHDWGLITLDRRVGQRTGWMGRETGTSSSLHFTGYPAEEPYVPPDTLVQYHGYDENNVQFYLLHRIVMQAFVYGGHSGGPTWRYSDPDRYINGINSTSDRVGNAIMTYLTNGKRTDLNSWMATDETDRPPTSRPDLIEYVFNTSDKDLYTNVLEQGDSFSLKYNVLNAGFSNSGDITVNFYLSTNDIISSNDNLIGTAALADLDAWSYVINSTSLTVPIDFPVGTYYVGWIMSCAQLEYNVDNNAVVISKETLTVNPKVYLNCSNAITLAPGIPYQGSTTGGYSNVDYYSCVDWFESGPEVTHKITIQRASRLEARLDYQSNPDLDLFILGMCNEYICWAYGEDTATLSVASPGTYYIVVDGRNAAHGDYTLIVDTTEVDVPALGRGVIGWMILMMSLSILMTLRKRKQRL
ncbi:hypothetical protein ACFL27_18750 [candidate division CSSED10-310 bacterium]|uniref:Serine protease n=1 Tax=candidate division CSSED10-310 bacterium TaxID=2855610 RepID=A0ABV6Z1C9_UNCC1